MKKQLLKRIVLFLTAITLTMACSKESDPIDQADEETVLSLASSEVLPGEAVQIKSNNKIQLGEIEVLLNSEPMKAYSIDDYTYVFVLPVMASGDYTLKVPVGQESQTLNLKVGNYAPIENPETVIDTYISNRDKCFDEMVKNGSSEQTPTSAETLALIDQIKQEWDVQYNQASTKDKELLAYLLQKQAVNPEWFTNDSFYGKKGTAGDVGDQLVATAKGFVAAQTVCVVSAPLTLGSGWAFVKVPNFITGGLFLASFTTFVISREVAIRKADQVARLEGVAGVILDFVTQKKSATELTNNAARSIGMTVGFRNLNSTDTNIQTDIAKAFSGEALLKIKDGELEKMYQEATKKMSKLKGLYPTYKPAIGKKAETTKESPVLGKDIIIKGSSNPLVTVSSYLEGDVRKIKATSASTSDINFNLKIAYKRALDGKEITKDIPFVFKAAPSLIGTWNLESEDGILVGQYRYTYFTDCPSIAAYAYITNSMKLIFSEGNSYQSQYVGSDTNLKKEVNSSCQVTKDGADEVTSTSGNESGTYQFDGNSLLITNEGVTKNLQVTFVTPNKINITVDSEDGSYVLVLNRN